MPKCSFWLYFTPIWLDCFSSDKVLHTFANDNTPHILQMGGGAIKEPFLLFILL